MVALSVSGGGCSGGRGGSGGIRIRYCLRSGWQRYQLAVVVVATVSVSGGRGGSGGDIRELEVFGESELSPEEEKLLAEKEERRRQRWLLRRVKSWQEQANEIRDSLPVPDGFRIRSRCLKHSPPHMSQ